MTLREKIQTMEAFERGEYVEVRTDKTKSGTWSVAVDPIWDQNNNDYRIKPKPKQVVVIEKWLFEDKFGIEFVQEIEKDSVLCYCKEFNKQKIKLLDTYEVEI